MAADSSSGKTDDGKIGAASAERNELPLQLLRNITGQFSEERRLGTGAFGTVYKLELLSEVVRCIQFDMISKPREVPKKMDWETRFKIIKGVCKGLLFLHSIPIVHMDLKPENIWLDNYMRPKIAEFGLSRIFGQEQTRMNAQNIVGSYGYIAPEYLYRGEISTMSDIYSLGLLIMETSTGEKNCPGNEPSAVKFIKNVRDNWTEERIASEYPSLDPDCLKQIKACINIGLECVEIGRRKRPSIEKIMDTLNRLSQVDSNNVLSLQPQRINFPIGPKRLTSSSLYLINNRDDRIAFRLETKFPRRYLTKLPLCGVVPPKCTYILTGLILQSSIAHHEDLDSVDPASVAMFLDTAGDEVQEAKVEVACEPLVETISNDQVSSVKIMIIDGPNYREVLSVDVHPTEPWILTSNKRGHVCIWNYQTQAENFKPVAVITYENYSFDIILPVAVYSAKFIEREGWFVVGGDDGCIYVYNYNTMKEVYMIEEAHDDRIMCLVVNPTHSFLLSASDDHKIKLWDWANEWQCTRTFEGHDDTVTQIWNIHSETCNITWDEHPDGVLSVHYHPRYFQQSLICGSSDGDAKIWDLETDSCVDTLEGHEKGINALCWHPELRALVTGSLDGTVRILSWMCHSNTYKYLFLLMYSLTPR
uniref:non-specific serine/threonine protein kinase n=1 Tax=Aegilops tauschii TaxID=37682 RepID=M8BXY4_AEGTA